MDKLEIRSLGQSGYLFTTSSCKWVVDPYLTNSVAVKYGPQFNRCVPIPEDSELLKNIDFIFLTHAHDDHTDIESIRLILKHSPQAKSVMPYESYNLLKDARINEKKLIIALEHFSEFSPGFSYRGIPAAHLQIERNSNNQLRYLGYCFDIKGFHVYHAGDTIPNDEIFRILKVFPAIDIAFLPVNERNYFKDKHGIVGNMSFREAIEMAQEIKTNKLIPIHWDMFSNNSVSIEEMELVYNCISPAFEMQIMHAGETINFYL